MREIWFHVTFRCNLSCAHCLFECCAAYDGIPDLELDRAKKYADSALRNGVGDIYITGGEPLTWKPLHEFLEYLNNRSEVASITLLTNGTLIDADWSAIFKTFEKLSIRISLECYTEQNNDEFRGSGSFKKTIRGIKTLNRDAIKPYICFTNKGGGRLNADDSRALEQDFVRVLRTEQGVNIAGLKVLGLYRKGRVTKSDTCAVCGGVDAAGISGRLSEVQCAYGIAVGPLGLAPCPILTDVPDAVISSDVDGISGTELEISFSCCEDCLQTGSTCGKA